MQLSLGADWAGDAPYEEKRGGTCGGVERSGGTPARHGDRVERSVSDTLSVQVQVDTFALSGAGKQFEFTIRRISLWVGVRGPVAPGTCLALMLNP